LGERLFQTRSTVAKTGARKAPRTAASPKATMSSPAIALTSRRRSRITVTV
jgi:hypothetical protein